MLHPRLLAVDTSTVYLQLALQTEDGAHIWSVDGGLQHIERLMPLVRSVLASEHIGPADITALICNRGPGSFTGLRIGMATLKGMAAALQIPLLSVSGLDSIALQYWDSGCWVLASIDARRQRFYTGLYDFSRIPIGQDLGQGLAAVAEAARIGPYLDASAEEIADLIGKSRRVRAGSTAGTSTLIISGSHGDLLKRELDSFLPKDFIQTIALPYSPWVLSLLKLGQEGIAAGLEDGQEQGPSYIRESL